MKVGAIKRQEAVLNFIERVSKIIAIKQTLTINLYKSYYNVIINDLYPILSCKTYMINHLMHHYCFPRIRKYINRLIYALLNPFMARYY